jgi:hypothetical protein
MKTQLSPVKPWHKMGITRRQYVAVKPWKNANMSREKFESIILACPQEVLDEARIRVETEKSAIPLLGEEATEDD